MKEIKLITFELPSLLAYLLKLVAIVAALYFAYDVYLDIGNEMVTRRGTDYSLAESPTSFYLNITKRVVFSIFFTYLAVSGIKAKKVIDS